MLFVVADFLIRQRVDPFVECTRLVKNYRHEFCSGTQRLVLVRDGQESKNPWVRVTFDEDLMREFNLKLRLNADETKLSVKVGKTLVDVEVTVTRMQRLGISSLEFKADMNKAVFKAVISHIVRALWG